MAESTFLVQPPIFTEPAECQDCYKCIRNCPVKAIKLEAGHAAIIPERCIICGICVRVCPVQAKKIRSDVERVRSLASGGTRLIAAVAPSLAGLEAAKALPPLTDLLIKAGFSIITDVSSGAAEVSRMTNDLLEQQPGQWISSACPSVHRYRKIHASSHAPAITPLPSPLLAHASTLKREHPDDAVVFIGPCAAKKWEADLYPEILAASLTIDELLDMAEHPSSSTQQMSGERGAAAAIENRRASAPTAYPIPGGMIEDMQTLANSTGVISHGLSGIRLIIDAIGAAAPEHPDVSSTFYEMLACPGGCMEGHCEITRKNALRSATALKRLRASVDRCSDTSRQTASGDSHQTPNGFIPAFQWKEITRQEVEADDHAVEAFLQSIGKFSPEDEKDCGGCGYDSCREFARMCVSGYGDAVMCVSNLRNRAEKKANALLHTIPSPLVIFDRDRNIVECNKRFLQTFAADAAGVLGDDFMAHVTGRPLRRFTDIELQGTQAIHGSSAETTLRQDKKVYSVLSFPIEAGSIAGAVFQDITEPFIQRESITEKARTVLETNVKTVQQIAYLLGENAARSEDMLRAIIESFGEGDAP